MENNICNICKSLNKTLVHQPTENYCLSECQNCGHIYTYFDEDINLSTYYEGGDYNTESKTNSLIDLIYNFECFLLIKKISKYLPSKGKILDFGCGKGRFLKNAVTNGWEAIGVETEASRAQYCKDKFNIPVITEYYESGMVHSYKFNSITLIHVLEHLSNPKELLGELIDSNLDVEGIIMLEIPNINSLQSKMAGKSWVHLDMPRHISHFNFKTITKLIKSINCEIIKVEYFSITNGILGMVQAIMCVLGFKKNIFTLLKYNRNFIIVSCLVLIFPFALILELVSSFFGYGGVIRVFVKKRF